MTMKRLLQLVQDNPGCKIVGGNTEMAIETNIKGAVYKCLVDPTWVNELTAIQKLSTGLKVRYSPGHQQRHHQSHPESRITQGTSGIDAIPTQSHEKHHRIIKVALDAKPSHDGAARLA
jgi:hypothetical protein